MPKEFTNLGSEVQKPSWQEMLKRMGRAILYGENGPPRQDESKIDLDKLPAIEFSKGGDTLFKLSQQKGFDNPHHRQILSYATQMARLMQYYMQDEGGSHDLTEIAERSREYLDANTELVSSIMRLVVKAGEEPSREYLNRFLVKPVVTELQQWWVDGEELAEIYRPREM